MLFYRLYRRGDLLTCVRNPGAFREPIFILKERNIFNSDFYDYKGIDVAIERLAAFHEAKEIIKKG